MMLAYDIQKILQAHVKDLNIDPEHIYSYMIDPNVRANDTDDIVILITEYDNTPQHYGSDKSIDRHASVQVQIFFPKSYENDTSILIDRMRDVFEDNNWYCDLDQGIKKDPDVELLMNLTRWSKIYRNK